MKFSVASVFAVLAATVSATPAFTNSAFDVVPGSTFTLTWGNATGPVTIVLATGTSDDLTKVETIDSGDSSGSFTWTVPTTLVSGNYAFEISDSTGVNYSKLFALTGTGSASASASTAVSTAVSSTSSSAAASSSTATTSSSSSSSTKTSSSSTTSSSSSKTTHLTTTTGSNSTTSATKTSTTGTKATTSATTVPANTNNGPQAKSPLAFVLVAVAALVYFN